MKRFIAAILALALLFAMTACDKNPKPAAPEKPGYTSSFEIEHVSDEAAAIGHVKCYDASSKELLWSYDTQKVYVAQLNNLQEIGFTSYGYLLLVDGNVVCLGTEGDDAGKELWSNGMFGGASASWDFDEDENLYICGYFGPELVIIDPTGATVSFYPPQFADDFFWPGELKYEDGFVYIRYDSNDLWLKVNPENGAAESIEISSKEDTKAILSGSWVDNISEPYIYLGFDQDGTLIAFRDSQEACYAYGGTWTCDENSFSMPVDDVSSDPLLEGFKNLGDYEIKSLRIENGVVVMELLQLNNGDSLISMAKGEHSPVMYKVSSSVDYTNPAMRSVRGAERDISGAVGTWTLVSAEIEGDRFNPVEAGIAGTLYIDGNGVADFKFVNHNVSEDPEELFSDMYPNIVPQRMYETILVPEEPAWYIDYQGDERNSFKAAITEYDVLEMFWYRGQMSADSYPAVLWMQFEKTSY